MTIKRIYKPTRDLYIKSIDPKTGKIIYDKIVNLSYHEGIDLWEVKDKLTNEVLAKVSGDHSLVVFIPATKDFQRISPKQLQEFQEQKKEAYLIRAVNEKNYELIPISRVQVAQIDRYAKGYDFETEKTKMFMLANGLLVYDTMMVTIPLSDEAMEEIKTKIMRDVFDPATGKFHFSISWDVTYGLYLLTKDEPSKPVANPQAFLKMSFDELLKFLLQHPEQVNRLIKANLKGKQVVLSLGRLLATKALPDWSDEIVTYTLKKKTINALLDRIAKVDFFKHNDVFDTLDAYYRLSKAGAEFSTLFPMDLDLFTGLEIKRRIAKHVEELAKKDLLTMIRGIDELMEKVKEYIKKADPTLYYAIDSGARGSWADVQQMIVSRGVVTDPTGRVIPKLIKHGLLEGLTQEEFFIMGYAARKGIVDRAINTDKPGYLLRQLVFANARVRLSSDLEDCGTTRCLEVYVADEDIAKSLVYKYDCNGNLIKEPPKVGSTVKIRSVLYCKSKEVCHKCYGYSYKIHRSKQIGIIAAQSLGERVQQTMLKSFHTGGLAKIKEFPKVIPDDCPYFEQKGDQIRIKAGEEILLKLEDIDAKISDSILVYEGELHFEILSGKEKHKYTLPFLYDNLILELYYDKIIEAETESGEIKRYAIIKRKKESIGQLWFSTEDISTKINIILQAFGGKLPAKTQEEYFQKLVELFKDFGVNIVHFEVVLSQMVRSKSKPELPWRLNQEDEYEIVGIKRIPFYESPLLALAFENIGQALTQGMLREVKETKPESFFEALLDNDLDALFELFGD